MSSLESRAKQVIEPLLHGRRTALDANEQALIATWAVKCAMVLEALGAEAQHVYLARERAAMKSAQTLPWRTTVWLACEPNGAHFFSAKSRHLSEDVPPSVTTTMAFAQLVIQVLTIRVDRGVGPGTRITTDVRDGPWELATIRTWPPMPDPIDWPPQIGLDGEAGLEALCQRFSVAEKTGHRLRSIAV